MQLVHRNLKEGIKLRVTSPEDLWHLSGIIESGDLVSSVTFRKVKKEGSKKIEVHRMFVKLKVEKVDFSAAAGTLRILGTVVDGPEDIPRQSHHSFSIEIDTTLTITKDYWHKYQLDKISEACKPKEPDIILVLHDREDAIFAKLTARGYDILSEIAGEVEKKDQKSASKNFYKEISASLEEYDTRYKPKSIIIASPSFWKEELVKAISPEIKKKAVLATASSVTKNGVDEVLKRSELKTVLEKNRSSEELKAVDELLQEVSTAGAAAYGEKETLNAVNSGAAKILLITGKFIQDKRERKAFRPIEGAMKDAEKMSCKIILINSDNEAGRKLDALGGIAAILRYRMNYS